jgi:hypothetical protein
MTIIIICMHNHRKQILRLKPHNPELIARQGRLSGMTLLLLLAASGLCRCWRKRMHVRHLLILACLMLPCRRKLPTALRLPTGMHVLPGLCAEIIASGLKMPRTCHLAGRQAAADRNDTLGCPARRLLQLEHKNGRLAADCAAKGAGPSARVVQGPDGKIYVGEVGRIIRFDRQHHSNAKPSSACLRASVIRSPPLPWQPMAISTSISAVHPTIAKPHRQPSRQADAARE